MGPRVKFRARGWVSHPGNAQKSQSVAPLTASWRPESTHVQARGETGHRNWPQARGKSEKVVTLTWSHLKLSQHERVAFKSNKLIF